MKQRRNLVPRHILPHIASTNLQSSCLKLHVNDLPGLRAKIADFVRLEQQCRGFLTFTLSESEEPLSLRINAPAGIESTLELFVNTARAA